MAAMAGVMAAMEEEAIDADDSTTRRIRVTFNIIWHSVVNISKGLFV